MRELYDFCALEKYRRELVKLDVHYQASRTAARAARKAHKRATASLAAHTEAQAALQQIAQAVQEAAHGKLAAVVTRCLAAVFTDPYEFAIRFERKRGRTEAKLVFVRDGEEVDPLTEGGGGPVDVAAFALRVACLCMAKPARRRMLVLDEPFRNVHGLNRQRLKGLLHTLATELGMQFIIATNEVDLQTGKVVDLGD